MALMDFLSNSSFKMYLQNQQKSCCLPLTNLGMRDYHKYALITENINRTVMVITQLWILLILIYRWNLNKDHLYTLIEIDIHKCFFIHLFDSHQKPIKWLWMREKNTISLSPFITIAIVVERISYCPFLYLWKGLTIWNVETGCNLSYGFT